MTHLRLPCLFSVLILLSGCASTARRVGNAHGLSQWKRHRAVAADVVVEFGGEKKVDGQFIFDTPVGKSRAEMTDGTVVVFDGEQAWVTPPNSPLKAARFHSLTWPYFMAAPMKLGDPGSRLTPMEDGDLFGRTCRRAKLTFDAGVGDAPDDWYILYIDPHTNWLMAMSYIVTYFNSPQNAEKEPHAIVYDDFITIGGVTFARQWRFHNYNDEQGIHGDPMGSARISNIRFVTPQEDTFAKPANAREDKLPGS